VFERHGDICWWKDGDEWGTRWVCHPEADFLDSLVSRISVVLNVEGSRFPRLLFNVWVMFSHRWVYPCHMPHEVSPQQLLVEKGSTTSQWSPGVPLAELFYTYLLNCPFNLWAHTADSPPPPPGQTWMGGGWCSPAVSGALTTRATVRAQLRIDLFNKTAVGCKDNLNSISPDLWRRCHPRARTRFWHCGGYFSADDLKSFLSHSLDMHFPITRSSMAFLKIIVMLLS
jgi:hypothetical protein